MLVEGVILYGSVGEMGRESGKQIKERTFRKALERGCQPCENEQTLHEKLSCRNQS